MFAIHMFNKLNEYGCFNYKLKLRLSRDIPKLPDLNSKYFIPLLKLLFLYYFVNFPGVMNLLKFTFISLGELSPYFSILKGTKGLMGDHKADVSREIKFCQLWKSEISAY